jgi:hypothetical protein
MNTSHWILLATFLSGLGMAISGLSDWREATSPQFISGLLISTGALIRALYVPPIQR